MFFILGMLIILSCLGLYLKSLYFQRRIQQWRRSYNLDHIEPIFNELYQSVNGFVLSAHARLQGDAFEYTYGEIEFSSFIALIAMVKPTPEMIFYDLGSGTGKPVIACALVFEMKQYYGIELFSELYESALQPKEKLKQIPEFVAQAERIHFLNMNFLDAEFEDKSLIFINATALFGPTWERLNERLTQNPNEKIIITTSKPLKSSVFKVWRLTQARMNFGVVTAYIHRFEVI